MAAILVAYATVYGSTREVAEAVANALVDLGHNVDVVAAREVPSVEGYSAVVLGGALYYFRWHKHARRFLSRNRTGLEGMPVAVFAMGPFKEDADEFAGARSQLDKALAKRAWLEPAAVEIFGGRFDPEGLRFPHNNPAMKQIPPSDIRDWGAIKAWAESLPTVLGVAASEAREHVPL